MNKIEVKVLNEYGVAPGGMMMFLARLTQRGHNIKNMDDLLTLYNNSILNYHRKTVREVAELPHGTIQRFTPITVAIVGASRRFLAQARTHQVGVNYVSASLQYSDYSGQADFVVPYELMDKKFEQERWDYLASCGQSMLRYDRLVKAGVSNDTAGYAAPQGLRNILVMQANHQAWKYLIQLRTCNRNTTETQYTFMRIWEELLKTTDGKEMFHWAGPDCCYGQCREGKMSCGSCIMPDTWSMVDGKVPLPTAIIQDKFPLLLQ